jgi:hypothetical protein
MWSDAKVSRVGTCQETRSFAGTCKRVRGCQAGASSWAKVQCVGAWREGRLTAQSWREKRLTRWATARESQASRQQTSRQTMSCWGWLAGQRHRRRRAEEPPPYATSSQ